VKVSTEKLEKSRVALDVEVEPEQLEKSMDRAYRRLVAGTSIPGFRPGKAPRQMFERFVGHARLLQEAIDIMVPEVYTKAIEEQHVEAVGQPEIEVTQLEPNVTFKATVAVRPTIELGDFSKLSFSREAADVTDEKVAEVIQGLRERNAVWEPVDRPVQLNDMVTFDVESTFDGQPYVTQKGAGFTLTEGRTDPIPGFVEALVGMKQGETKTFDLAYPDDWDEESVRGKVANFTITMTDVKEKRLPAEDDDFAKTVGDYETFAALREKVVNDLKEALERDSQNRIEMQVLDGIAAVSQLDYPDLLIDHEMDHMMEDDRTLPRDPQGRVDEVLKLLGTTALEFRERYREEATNRVVRSLVLQKLTESEAVDVSDDDVNAEIQKALAEAGEQTEALRQWFESEERRESVRSNLVPAATS
jgi:trigger factor